jgi:hypothetical protein
MNNHLDDRSLVAIKHVFKEKMQFLNTNLSFIFVCLKQLVITWNKAEKFLIYIFCSAHKIGSTNIHLFIAIILLSSKV